MNWKRFKEIVTYGDPTPQEIRKYLPKIIVWGIVGIVVLIVLVSRL